MVKLVGILAIFCAFGYETTAFPAEKDIALTPVVANQIEDVNLQPIPTAVNDVNDADLKGSETFGFGYYPGMYDGYGYGAYGRGFGGYAGGYGYGARYGYGGYHRYSNYGGYAGYGGYQRRTYPYWR